jgi:hypothetical protein
MDSSLSAAQVGVGAGPVLRSIFQPWRVTGWACLPSERITGELTTSPSSGRSPLTGSCGRRRMKSHPNGSRPLQLGCIC